MHFSPLLSPLDWTISWRAARFLFTGASLAHMVELCACVSRRLPHPPAHRTRARWKNRYRGMRYGSPMRIAYSGNRHSGKVARKEPCRRRRSIYPCFAVLIALPGASPYSPFGPKGRLIPGAKSMVNVASGGDWCN